MLSKLRRVRNSIRQSSRNREASNSTSFLDVADAARDRKDWTVAAKNYQLVLSETPSRPDIWTQYGHALKESGQLSEALDAYKRALSLDDQNSDIFVQLGHAYKLLGNLDSAKNSYNKAHQIDPNNSDAKIELVNLSPASMNEEVGEGPKGRELADLRTLLVSLKKRGSESYGIFQNPIFNEIE